MDIHKKISSLAKRSACLLFAFILAAGGMTGAYADTRHDELDYTVTVKAKRSTITVNPNNGLIYNPATGDAAGQTGQFTITGKVNTSVNIGAGTADAAHLSSLQESDTSDVNLQGFTYTFGAKDETVTAKWKSYKTFFNGNGGTSGATEKSTEYNHTNTMPNATRTNYTFNGWYTATSGGTRVGGNGSQYTQTGTQPTYYAQWACNHPGTKAVNKNDATYHRLVCTQCGATMNENAAHGYGGWTQHDGTNHKRTCTACGYVQYAGHSYGGWSNNNTTNHKRTCSVCGYVQYQNHSGSKSYTSYGAWSLWKWNGSAYVRTRTANYQYTCSTCSAVYSTGSETQTETHSPATYHTGQIIIYGVNQEYGGRNIIIERMRAYKVLTTRFTREGGRAARFNPIITEDDSPEATVYKRINVRIDNGERQMTLQGYATSAGSRGNPATAIAYASIQAAGNAGYEGTLYAVYKGTWNGQTSYYNAGGHYHVYDHTWRNG